MGITQLNFEGIDKVQTAIDALRFYEPPEGYYLADSGGKDSTAVRLLAKMSGVKFDAHYCVSPIDPKPLQDFLKKEHPDTIWDYHARGFWGMVFKKGLPMRKSRWCCEIIKEGGGDGRIVITGVRAKESIKRKHSQIYQQNYKKTLTYMRPIVDWDSGEVWEFLKSQNEPYCEIYDIGASDKYSGDGTFRRLGCVLCPMGGHPELEEQYFPKIANLWLLVCNRLVAEHIRRGYKTKRGEEVRNKFKTGQELYDWWIARR